MASSETDIVNTALILLGEPTILSLTDDLDVAIAANTIWPDVRDDVLAEHPWNGCVEATRAHAPRRRAPGLSSLYVSLSRRCPQGPATGRGLVPVASRHGQQADEKLIWSDDPSPIVRYIARTTNVALYSPGLALTLAKRMAAELALTITAHHGKAELFFKAYELQLVRAKMRDAQEQSPVTLQATYLTTDVRRGGG